MHRSQPGSDLRPDFEHQVTLEPARAFDPNTGRNIVSDIRKMKGSSRVLYLGKEVISPVQRSAALNRGM
jgi:hypothetical protein